MAYPERSPTLASSVWIGARGFTVLGLAGFLPWALGTGRWLGEGGMFALCAIVFIALSGPLLHRLTPGPGSLWRFQILFTLAFVAYAAVWTLVWFKLRIHLSDYFGLALGTLAFSLVTAWRLNAWKQLPLAFVGLAVLHTAGYWVGDEIYVTLRSKAELQIASLHLNAAQCALIAKLGWGILYGVGFGAGIGWLFGVSRRR